MVGRREAFSVDLNQPLAFQVGYLGEGYEEWVHQPILTKGSPRLFPNQFLELFTRTQWWEVPLFWWPVVWRFVNNNNNGNNNNNIITTTVVVVVEVAAGLFMWTFLEYCLHRFLFHIKTISYWGNTLHYIFHGFHHKHPMDHLRLVLPPPTTALFVVFFWNLTKIMVPVPHSSALFGGALLGYVIYDCTHYYLHHGKPASHQRLKKYHMNHHFGIQDKGFGVSSGFWDFVFGTLP